MKTQKIIGIILLIAGIALTVVSLILLPETVVVQFTAGGQAANTMPKIIAILIPAALTLGGAVAEFIQKPENNQTTKSKNSPLIISIVGIGVFIMSLVVNLAVK